MKNYETREISRSGLEWRNEEEMNNYSTYSSLKYTLTWTTRVNSLNCLNKWRKATDIMTGTLTESGKKRWYTKWKEYTHKHRETENVLIRIRRFLELVVSCVHIAYTYILHTNNTKVQKTKYTFFSEWVWNHRNHMYTSYSTVFWIEPIETCECRSLMVK